MHTQKEPEAVKAGRKKKEKRPGKVSAGRSFEQPSGTDSATDSATDRQQTVPCKDSAVYRQCRRQCSTTVQYDSAVRALAPLFSKGLSLPGAPFSAESPELLHMNVFNF